MNSDDSDDDNVNIINLWNIILITISYRSDIAEITNEAHRLLAIGNYAEASNKYSDALEIVWVIVCCFDYPI